MSCFALIAMQLLTSLAPGGTCSAPQSQMSRAPQFAFDDGSLDSCDPGCHLDMTHHRIPTCVCPL